MPQNATSTQDSVEVPGFWRCMKEIWLPQRANLADYYLYILCKEAMRTNQSWLEIALPTAPVSIPLDTRSKHAINAFLLLQYPFRKNDQAFYHTDADSGGHIATNRSSMVM